MARGLTLEQRDRVKWLSAQLKERKALFQTDGKPKDFHKNDTRCNELRNELSALHSRNYSHFICWSKAVDALIENQNPVKKRKK